MASDFRPEARQNPGDNVFAGTPVGQEEGALFAAFLDAHAFSSNSRRAFTQDMRKFAAWFSNANRERFVVGRVTTRDIADFRDHLRREQGQAVATINRALVTVRRFFTWLTDQGHVATNPAKKVKGLKRVALAPKGLDRSQVRRLLREVELPGDLRAGAVFSLMLYTGCRGSDLVNLELADLLLGERGGTVVFRLGKAVSSGRCRCPSWPGVRSRRTSTPDLRCRARRSSSASEGR
jgi:site-specific recombinase XerD